MVKYDHLLHKQFKYGKQDCFTLLRDFYRDNFDILLPNYARPKKLLAERLEPLQRPLSKERFCHPGLPSVRIQNR